MRRSARLLIALVATVIVCAQNILSLTGFTWALIHGAGVESALAFAPAALRGVRVLEVRDEPLLSAQGNPIGVPGRGQDEVHQ